MPQASEHRNPVHIEGDAEGAFRPLIFGEALFDHFPDGGKVLGGAPFNVAWHLQGFKARPLVVTAVGKDAEGDEILRRMDVWGMDTSCVQVHTTRPTGRVTAHIKGDEARYEIEARQAYDAIAVEKLPPLSELGGIQLLSYGSLGLREETSAAALTFLKEGLDVPVLLDVNLRDPWWTPEGVARHLQGAHWVKLNREEAGILARLPVGESGQLSTAAGTLRERHRIGTLVVTMGREGAMALATGGEHWQAAPHLPGVVDPVGAGDAFNAVLALGIHFRWPLDTMLGRAVEFAGELCQVRGATSENPELYTKHLRRWADAA